MRACSALSERPPVAGRPHPAGCRRWRRLWLTLLLLCPPLPAAATAEADQAGPPFVLPNASVREVDNVYRLDAVARLRLTQPVREALDNGVDLTIAWEVEIDRRNDWWLDSDVAYIVQRYRLSFHELSLQYVVTNLNTGQQRSYTRLQTALDRIGTLIGFPLIDRVLLDDGGRYNGHVRVRLLQEELPLPLRAVALFSGAWKLESEWYQWSFE